MPSLKYYDPTAGAYKYLVGGLNQETADARYLMSGFRNVIRNGDMSIAQRGNGPVEPTVVLIDGWGGWHGPGTHSYSRELPVPGVSGYLAKWVASGQTTEANAQANLSQSIEDVSTLSGQTATLSFVAKAASGTPKIGIRFYQAFGSGGSASLDVHTSNVTISTTLTRYVVSPINIPSIAGKTVGTASKLGFDFWFSGGTNHSAISGGIPIQNNTFWVGDVQLEAGSVATPFERIPQQQQLAWCQRYFQRMTLGTTLVTGFTWTTNTLAATLRFPVVMRVGPSFSLSAASHFSATNNAGGPSACSAVAVSDAQADRISLNCTASGLVTGQVGNFQISNAAGYLDFSAEL